MHSSCNRQQTIKLAMIGDPCVGKTALQKRFMGKGFLNTYLSTLGAEFVMRNIKLDEKCLEVSILDLGGNKYFHNLRKLYFKSISAAMLVYDTTKPYSIQMQTFPWVEELIEFTNNECIPLAVVGNKVDLEEIRQIESYQGFNVATEIHEMIAQPVEYFETSAKTRIEVDSVFTWLIQSVSN